MKLKKITVSLFAAGMMASPLANATNGYFSHGYGLKAKGMGGAATAMAIDAMGGANNPCQHGVGRRPAGCGHRLVQPEAEREPDGQQHDEDGGHAGLFRKQQQQ